MSSLFKRLVNPIFIPVISVPHFILGCLAAAHNWQHMGHPSRAMNTVKWGVVGTIVVVILALNTPVETLKKMWPVGVGVNLGVGMALRTLQLPEYEKKISKSR